MTQHTDTADVSFRVHHLDALCRNIEADRDRLAAELATMTEAFGALIAEVAALPHDIETEQTERGDLRAIADQAIRYVNCDQAEAETGEPYDALVHAVRVHERRASTAPGSSRRAQEPESVKYAGNPRRHAVAFNALTRALRIADRFVALSEREAVTTAVLNALDGDAPQSGQGWDPSSPQWAVIRAARVLVAAVAEQPEPTKQVMDAYGDLRDVLDALPHAGEHGSACAMHLRQEAS